MTSQERIGAIIDEETADMSWLERIKFLHLLEGILRDRMECEPEPEPLAARDG